MSLRTLGKFFVKYGGSVAKPVLDTVTDPKTYRGLAQNVDDVLQRKIPQAGVNIQNAPMSLLGKVNDIFDMAPGRAKEEARNQLQRNFKMADRLSKGAPAPRGGLSSTGALKAPNVGSQVSRRPGLSPASVTPASPSFNAQDFRDIGGPQLRSSLRPNPSKGRVPKGFAQGVKPGAPGKSVGRAVYPGQPNPITGPAPTKLAGTGGVGKSLMNFVAPGQNPLGRAWGFSGRALNAVGLYEGARKLTQGDVGGAAASLASSFPGRTLGLASRALGGIAKPLIGATALLALTPGSGGNSSLNDYYQTLTPEQKKKFEAETRSQQENMSAAEKRTMGMPPAETDVIYGTIPPSVNDDLPGQNYDSSVTLPGAPTINTFPNNLPSSPEAVVANPLQQKMAEYEQRRANATTQEEMNAVRDLGMSIHQAAYPQMYEESYNPLMAATFPERYQKTPEDFIVQGGIQAPRSMIEKDAAQATAFGNKVQNIQGLDVKPMYYPFEAAEEQSMLDVKPMYNPFEAAEEQSMLLLSTA
jgi:hypothetical protein